MKLLFLERVILETLGRGKRELNKICQDCSVERNIVENILFKFFNEKLILKNKEDFLLDFSKREDFLEEIKKKGNIKEELKELLNYFLNIFINSENKVQFGLKKVWVEEKDEKMLELYLSKIDLLLKKAEASNKSNNSNKKLSLKKVIFWGYCEYELLIKEALKL